VFTDINMPGRFDGLCLAQTIARIRPDIRLILTSGRAPPPRGVMPEGARFLPKPYSYASLTALIDQAA
jgi:DNA-binding NtrC family response regulator